MLRGGIYVRISIDDEGDGKGIARHLRVARSLAKERGISVPDELVFDRDNDLSGSGEVYRPDYVRMVEAVKSGQVDAIVTSEIERLQRGLKEYVEFYEAAEARGLLVVWEGGSANFATGEGIDALEDAAVSARKELRKIRRRVRRKHEELLQDGKYIGQHRAFGYRWDGGLVVVPDEAELIREAVHRVLNGDALNAICGDWNQRGIRTVEGNPWGQRSLKRVLVSGRISGRRDYGIASGGGRLAIPRIVTEGDWPAIVDPELSDAVRTLLASNSRPSAPRRHLLTGGLTRCALCGAHLQPRVESGVKGGLALHCRRGHGYHGCGRVSVTMEPLERFVVGAVLEAIDMGALRAALDRRDDPGAREELADVDGRLADLARMWGERQLTGPEWTAAKAPLDTRRQTLVRRIEASRRTVGLDDLPDRLCEGWQDLSLPKRRGVVAAIIEAVNVHPAGSRGERFTDKRVTIRWRA